MSAIDSGSSISHYTILGPLGSGGMGEVYVARDTSLDRTVALKILPPDLTRSEERVRRFVQEAKSASSLSHPHIVTIHEIGNAEVRSDVEGTKSDPLHFIAMELIDGQTLGAKIHREKADLRTLLEYLKQSAEGLAKAHAAGIVHRDLKPENIMVTSDGYAKILDFGLAKLQVRKDADASLNGATAVRNDTREGTILGTVGYMSPEQVQGKAVDHRSDIFSFGCILYEAATHQRPFRADSDVDVMHQILHDKPQPIEEIAPDVPTELRRIIRRCLAKEPDKRFQSMKDLALELGEIVEEFDSLPRSDDSRRATSSGSVSAPAIQAIASRPTWLIASLAGLIVLGAVALLLLRRQPTTPAPAAKSFASMKIERLTSTGNITRAAISPDNRYLANVVLDGGKYSMNVRQIATGADAEVVHPASLPIRGVTFSPDGNYLYFVQAESEQSGYSFAYQIPSLGGPPRKLLFDIDTAPSFAADGKRFTFVRGYPQFNQSALMQFGLDGGGEKKIAERKGERAFPLLPAAWSPDGKKIAVIGTTGRDPQLLAVDVATGAEQRVGETKWYSLSGVAWLPDGSGIVLAAIDRAVSGQGQLWLVDYPSGKVTRITNDLNNYVGASVTSDGRSIAAVQSNAYVNLTSVTPGAAAVEKPLTRGTQENSIGPPGVLPDGSLLFVSFVDGKSRLSEISPAGVRKQIPIQDDALLGVNTSSDGGTILGVHVRDGVSHVVRLERDGSNIVELTHGASESGVRVSPDATWFVYRTADLTVMRMPTNGGTPTKVADHSEARPGISPDGTRVVVIAQEQDADRARGYAIVVPAGGGKPIARIHAEGASFVSFSPAGDAIDVVQPGGGADNIWRYPISGGPPKRLTSFTDGIIASFVWMPDGRSMVITRPQSVNDVVLISNFR